jgi:lipopolysaccharide exporter
MGYSVDAAKGFSWQTFHKIITTLLAVLKIYILARLLEPSDFGLFSLTAVALGLTESLTQTGINLTILQSKKSAEYFINTAWIIAIFRGLLISAIMIILGYFMGQFFNEPLLFSLISTAALIPIIKGFINPYIVSLQKNLRFFQDTLYRFSFIFIEIVLVLIFAFYLKNVWAFIYALIGGAVFEVLISFVFFKHRPKLNYSKSIASIIFKNAKGLNLAAILHYLNEQIDNLLIGKQFASHLLGIYQNSYALSHRTNYELSKSMHHGTMPVFTKIADDNKRINKAFKKTFIAMFGIAFFASIPFFIFPKLSVEILLGAKWLEAIPLIRPLILAGFIQAITTICHTLFLAKKKYNFVNWHLFLSLIFMTSLIIILGKQYGLLGSVYGILIARLLALPVLGLGLFKNAR